MKDTKTFRLDFFTTGLLKGFASQLNCSQADIIQASVIMAYKVYQDKLDNGPKYHDLVSELYEELDRITNKI